MQNSGVTGKLSRLLLSRLTIADEGVYRCRVDYAQAPTKIDNVKLSMLVPPSSPVIYDDHDIPLNSIIGPFHLGSNITLSCVTRGGSPLPILIWTIRRSLESGPTSLNVTSKVHTTEISSSKPSEKRRYFRQV